MTRPLILRRPLLAALAVAAALPAAAQDPPAAVLEFEPRVLDFGTVLTGEKATATAEFRNASDRELRVRRCQSTCGCLAPTVVVRGERLSPEKAREGFALAPGERGQLEVEFNGAGRRGEVRKQILFFAEDLPLGRAAIDVVAQCDPGYSLEPIAFDFAEPVIRGKTATRSVVLLPSEQWRAKITGATYRVAGVVAACQPLADEAGAKAGRVRIDLTITADAPVGPLLWPLEVKTDSAAVPVILIPVRAEVTPVVQCTGPDPAQPRVLDFGIVEDQGPVSREAVIHNHAPAVPYHVRRTVIDSPQRDHVAAEVVTEKAGERYRLRVTVLPSLKDKDVRGSVRVESDHPEVPVLEIWFRGWVKRR